jgi:hypothetical protein
MTAWWSPISRSGSREVWDGGNAQDRATWRTRSARSPPGKQADIAVIDLRSPHPDGFGDPVAGMVLSAGPADVETVIVGGDIVKRHASMATCAAVRAGPPGAGG